MGGKRGYRMAVRAEATAATARRIIDAAITLHTERFSDQITLTDVATRAGVTVPTVLRHFGSKDHLIEAAAEVASAEVRTQRWSAQIGDIAGAVDNLLDHYEERGPLVLRLLAQEDRVAQFRPLLDRGRGIHSEWVERTFAPFLSGIEGAQLAVMLAVATDVYVWKLLRLDRGLDREATRTVLIEMLEAMLNGGRAS